MSGASNPLFNWSKLMTQSFDVVVSFDTTGSMYPCLAQVRRKVSETINRLFDDIPGIRIGIIAHGDYCDAHSSYVTRILNLNSERSALVHFVNTVGPTNGGDAPECYELVLHQARSLDWQAEKRVLVLIGDDLPHSPAERLNTLHLDWRNELAALLDHGINVYGVQALGRPHATAFYREIAERTGGFKLDLNQFSHVVDTLLAVCYKQVGDEKLASLQQELIHTGRFNRSLEQVMHTLRGGGDSPVRYEAADLKAVHPARFQVLNVDSDISIKEFVTNCGAGFKVGRGFYQFSKREMVQENKEVVLVHGTTGDMFSGERAREMLGLPFGIRGHVSPGSLEYDVFIQSTSANRKLVAGTKFLYEVEDWTE
jgi:hypothetical protein